VTYDFKRWSASALGTIQLCGEKFRRKHLEKEYRAGGPAAARGIAVNRVKNEAHKRQMVAKGIVSQDWESPVPRISELPGSPRSVEEARDIAAKEFAAAIKRGVSFSKAQQAEGVKAVLAQEKDAAVNLGALYVRDVAPPIDPVGVERKIVVAPQDVDFEIVGYLDLVERLRAGDWTGLMLAPTPENPFGGKLLAVDGDECVPDVKTKDKAPFKDAARLSSQLTMYAMLRRLEVGRLPRSLRLIHLVQTPKDKKRYVDVQFTVRDEEDVTILIRRLNVAVESVRRGVFVPADPSAPGSPCGWCEYSGDCRYVRAPKSV